MGVTCERLARQSGDSANHILLTVEPKRAASYSLRTPNHESSPSLGWIVGRFNRGIKEQVECWVIAFESSRALIVMYSTSYGEWTILCLIIAALNISCNSRHRVFLPLLPNQGARAQARPLDEARRVNTDLQASGCQGCAIHADLWPITPYLPDQRIWPSDDG